MTMTKHFQMERVDRFVYLATTIGLGEVVYRKERNETLKGYGKVIVEITSTGIKKVIDANEDKLITMYLITEKELRYYIKNPTVALRNKVRKNAEKGYISMQNKIKLQKRGRKLSFLFAAKHQNASAGRLPTRRPAFVQFPQFRNFLPQKFCAKCRKEISRNLLTTVRTCAIIYTEREKERTTQ